MLYFNIYDTYSDNVNRVYSNQTTKAAALCYYCNIHVHLPLQGMGQYSYTSNAQRRQKHSVCTVILQCADGLHNFCPLRSAAAACGAVLLSSSTPRLPKSYHFYFTCKVTISLLNCNVHGYLPFCGVGQYNYLANLKGGKNTVKSQLK